ncbi:HAD superfamily hydrolase (TIGR01459 family) [Chelatococcus caeni]|uniref:HAD superfamily hydrolase (TIGR01459 family) n=1 Tax=Chelatococcus caeni TaxID=1348468 RepID=A0A840BY53_9HYPH|nr:TIGR01459 family HAD-type hydrolase [Chelatococcus caeni]MBB4015207.1 HAD superfamily hydrolase (TIGR01459 family) [Chelatococcus caeni]
MTDRPASPPPIIQGLRTIADRYDVILCDIWGVLHNGLEAFAPAGEALQQFRQRGGQVVLVSNAPRPNGDVLTLLDGFGVKRAAYDAAVTSGDVTRSQIAARPGEPLLHIGPDRDLPLFDGLDAPLTAAAEARYAVCTGLVDDERETPDDYAGLLAEMHAGGVPMICANPDLVVERGTALIYCAGALAAAYEEIGGTVTYAGKPHKPIYERALGEAERIRGAHVPVSRVLAIGDAIRTDVAGAHSIGADALLVTRGIHAAEISPLGGSLDEIALAAWLEDATHRPQAIIESLVW